MAAFKKSPVSSCKRSFDGYFKDSFKGSCMRSLTGFFKGLLMP